MQKATLQERIGELTWIHDMLIEKLNSQRSEDINTDGIIGEP